MPPRASRRSFLKQIALYGTTGVMTGCGSIPDRGQLNTSVPAPPKGEANRADPAGQEASLWIIDTHLHVVQAMIDLKPSPGEMDALLKGPPEPMAKVLRSQMAEAKVALALGMGRLGGPESDALGIESTLRVAQLVPSLRTVGVADPRRT